jgi:DNA-directed RNA polymerase subunit alpha
MLITQRPTISQERISDTRYKFTIEPLEPGFGYTIGNSLRRTLLSSIPGAAITSVKIDGVRHKFETKDGVKEDITEIILNLKELVVSSEINEPAVMYINTDKSGPITAADIKVPAGVKVHNPDLHIATLSKGSFEAEFVVERGRGYVSEDDNKKLNPNLEVDRIVVDSIYSPVLRVSYDVEATRVGQHTNFDKLVVDVTTKASTSPVDVIASAGKTLIELFGLVRSLNEQAEGVELGADPIAALGLGQAADAVQQDMIGLEFLDIPNRAINVLKRQDITTIEQLANLTEANLLAFDSMGKSTVEHIKEALKAQGFQLAG